MRPRISKREANYMVEVLSAQHNILQKKYEDLVQLELDYHRIIFELKNPVQRIYDNEGHLKGHRILGNETNLALVRLAKLIKAEHPKLVLEKFKYVDCLHTHETLIQKYRLIAEGKKHRGRYPHFCTRSYYPEQGKLIKELNGKAK
jgi:hypothetical protein